MAITADAKRQRLEKAWNDTPDSGNVSVRQTLLAAETAVNRLLEGGSLASIGSSGRSSVFSLYGPGQITTTEMAALYRQLIDQWDSAGKFLRWCATYGFPANQAELWSGISQSLAIHNPAITLDPDGYWAELCITYSVDATTVINQTVADGTIFLWLMDHIIAIREARSDYSWLRTGGGMQWA